jgi:hypothetical protein
MVLETGSQESCNPSNKRIPILKTVSPALVNFLQYKHPRIRGMRRKSKNSPSLILNGNSIQSAIEIEKDRNMTISICFGFWRILLIQNWITIKESRMTNRFIRKWDVKSTMIPPKYIDIVIILVKSSLGNSYTESVTTRISRSGLEKRIETFGQGVWIKNCDLKRKHFPVIFVCLINISGVKVI